MKTTLSGLIRLGMLLILLLFFSFPAAQAQQFAQRGDSVQHVLQRLAMGYPKLVNYIPQTGRLYLQRDYSIELPEAAVAELEAAFYYDFGAIFEYYGLKYLADWRALASKAARETYWGTSYLCNRANNYFGIRRTNKEWACTTFGFCETVQRHDPELTDFVVFPNFEASLWMFMHTIYSPHFLERLPDLGERVFMAVRYERATGIHYWDLPRDDSPIFASQLTGGIYTSDELIFTWSEHPINNLCVNCSRETDREWVSRLDAAVSRAFLSSDGF